MSKESPQERKLREALKSKSVEVPAKPTQEKLDKILDKAKKKR